MKNGFMGIFRGKIPSFRQGLPESRTQGCDGAKEISYSKKRTIKFRHCHPWLLDLGNPCRDDVLNNYQSDVRKGVLNKFILIISLLISSQVFAIDDHQLPDPEQQKTYELINSELRCLVCQNQTIADSNAELAGDLRRQVYEMLQQGKSKDEIVQFMTERYGDFVLYNPPLKTKTALLWLGPIAFLMIGFVIIFWVIRRKKKAALITIDRGKQEKIRHLLLDNDENGDHS
jgi:cytochrome c-type biogenesis protein CcmH